MRPTAPAGHLKVPITETGSPVLVLHAWWGLNDTMKNFCTRLSESGFVAFAPDLFHGKIADNVADAETLARAHDGKQAQADVADSAKFLIKHADAPNLGISVVGFSFGAYYALDLSVADPKNIRSVVVFYGTGPTDFNGSKAAYLGHFAENDQFEPQSSVDELEAALRDAGRPAEIHRYPGTGHWFFEPDRKDAFNQAAATLAWDRTVEFLNRPPAS